MPTPRILGPEQERQVALTYLCGVDTEYIGQLSGVSFATITQSILGKRSHEWDDPLVEFYRQTSRDRVRSGIHLYLVFNGQGDGLPHADLVDKEREEPVYEFVNGTIFTPRTKSLIVETNLERILESTKPQLSGAEKLLQAVFCSYYTPSDSHEQALEFVTLLIYQKLREAYQQDKRVNIDSIYAQITDEVFRTLNHGLSLVQNPDVVEYARSVEREGSREALGEIEEVLSELRPREREVLEKRFFEGRSQTDIGKDYDVGRGRISQIEARALRRLRYPPRAERLKKLF